MIVKGVYAFRKPTQKSLDDFEFLSRMKTEFPQRDYKVRELGKLSVTFMYPKPSAKAISHVSELRKLSGNELERYFKQAVGKHALSASGTAITGVEWFGQATYKRPNARALALMLDDTNDNFIMDHQRIADALPGYIARGRWRPHLTIAYSDIDLSTDDIMEWVSANAPERVVLGPLQYEFPLQSEK